MRWTATALGIVTLLAMSVTPPIGAQELTSGTWTGTMSPPGGGSLAVSYEVDVSDGALSIVMSANGQSLSLNEVALDGDALTFWWEPGTRVNCRLLRREDGSFAGTCSEGTGADGEGTLTMVPPSGQDRS